MRKPSEGDMRVPEVYAFRRLQLLRVMVLEVRQDPLGERSFAVSQVLHHVETEERYHLSKNYTAKASLLRLVVVSQLS